MFFIWVCMWSCLFLCVCLFFGSVFQAWEKTVTFSSHLPMPSIHRRKESLRAHIGLTSKLTPQDPLRPSHLSPHHDWGQLPSPPARTSLSVFLRSLLSNMTWDRDHILCSLSYRGRKTSSYSCWATLPYSQNCVLESLVGHNSSRPMSW
jgi:hypothetical protein